MSEQRKQILDAIRESLGRPRPEADAIAAEADALLGDPARFQPRFEGQSNRARFIERATSERLSASVAEIDTFEAAPAAVGAYLEQHGLPPSISCPPLELLQTMDWGGITHHETLTPNEPVVVNAADWAIAETGSLVFASRADSPTLYSFLPLHHVILIEARKILRYTEDYWAEVRSSGNVHPRSINFITGTSGTADIEAQNIRGAHGPRFMHIIIIGADAAS